MNIKAITYKLLAVVAIWTFASCSENELKDPEGSKGIEMNGITAHMTRAGQVAELKDYVGKSEFDDKDRAVFVTIKRTKNPINQFTYSNLEFECSASTSAEGVTSIGWSRDKTKGTTAAGGGEEAHPDRIYWSDATNPHTFIGYCAPQQGGGKAFDWEKKTINGIDHYYGSIGDPTLHTSTDSIDYRSTFDSEGNETQSGNVELRKNDILLTHSTTVKAEDAIAKLYFYHGLAQVRVIVNISEFAAGGGADTLSRVSDMVLEDMRTMYKWDQLTVATEELTDHDQAALNELYPSAGVTYDQTKNFNLWIPEPKGVGYKSSRTFTFYGMVVPHALYPEGSPLRFSFKVTYPDPMQPTEMKTHKYSASIANICFDAGKCTTISISLNHKNEKMTVGAEYDDWEFVHTPDQGELKKKTTFLASGDVSKVTWHEDPNATIDDATWLYLDNGTIVDLYGNDGTTEAKAYTITTAEELLSFAKEVNNGNSFTDQFVKLDANIYLQKSLEDTDVIWPGIGDADHAFNGTFLGGTRSVKLLSGKPFFVNIGPKARIDALLLEEVLDVTSGGGAFAELNQGVICASTVTSKSSGKFNVVGKSETITYNNNNITSTVAGSMVGRNEGVVFACHSQGSFTTNAARVGGLVGYNTGALVVSYTATKATTTSTAAEKIYRGIVGYNNFAPEPLPDGKAANEYGTITYCFFDKDIDDNVREEDVTDHVSGKTTVEMKRSNFIGENDRYSKLTDAEKTILETLEARERSGETLTSEEQTLKDRLLKTLNGNIAYFAYHSSLCPKVIKDAYHDTGADAQMQVLVEHFLNHYYMFRVGDYPQVY